MGARDPMLASASQSNLMGYFLGEGLGREEFTNQVALRSRTEGGRRARGGAEREAASGVRWAAGGRGAG